MRNAIAFGLFLVSVVLGVQSYKNAQPGTDTLEMSREAVCSLYGGCARGVPSKVQTGALSRAYEWLTPEGPWVATCKRSAVFFGAWACKDTRPGKLNVGGSY